MLSGDVSAVQASVADNNSNNSNNTTTITTRLVLHPNPLLLPPVASPLCSHPTAAVDDRPDAAVGGRVAEPNADFKMQDVTSVPRSSETPKMC